MIAFPEAFDCKNISFFALFTLFYFRSSNTIPRVNINCVIMFSVEELYKMYLLVFFTISCLDVDQQSNPYNHHLQR